MERVTKKKLEVICARINAMTGSPAEPYTRTGDSFRANIGNYHLSGAYGGYALHRMENESGGISDVLRIGHVPKRELQGAMLAYIAGLDARND